MYLIQHHYKLLFLKKENQAKFGLFRNILSISQMCYSLTKSDRYSSRKNLRQFFLWYHFFIKKSFTNMKYKDGDNAYF